MRENRGQVLIEAAIVIPLLLLLIFGIVDFARAMYTKNTLTNAARAGARTASMVVPPPSPESGGITPAITETAKAINNSIFSPVQKQSVSYDLAIFVADSSGNLTRTAAAAVTNNVLQVTVTYDLSMITPFYKIAALITNSSAPSSSAVTLKGEASMRRE